MHKQFIIVFLPLFFISTLYGQNTSTQNYASIDIGYNEEYNGFELLEGLDQKQLFLFGETKHSLRKTPAATLKIFKYLYENANTRILAIEHGYSVAYLMNEYLETKDSLLLKQISRNTMYWGKENFVFMMELAEFNDQLPTVQKIVVRSIDVEYKAESAILVINKLLKNKAIPNELASTVGEYFEIFEENRHHREQFDGLNVFNFYDRDRVEKLIIRSLSHLKADKELLKVYFGENFQQYQRIVQDLYHGYIRFDASKPKRNFKYRDNIIYDRLLSVMNANDKGIMCVIGNAHMSGKASGNRPQLTDNAIRFMIHTTREKRIVNLRLNALNKKTNNVLRSNVCTLIKHGKDRPYKPSMVVNDYTIFFSDGKTNTPFENTYTE